MDIEKIVKEMEKQEFDPWFILQQLLSELILNDIKEELKVGNIPSTAKKKYEMINTISDIVEQCFWYLKERGVIRILSNPHNNTDIIVEREWVEKMGFNFDQVNEK